MSSASGATRGSQNAAPGAASAAAAASSAAAIDWAELRQEADSAAASAYAPYSGLRVGAAALSADGRIVTGCNVENASYGMTLCAECSLVSLLVGGGGGRLVAVAVTAGDGRPLAPCGRCRQLLMEHGGPDLLVDAGAGHEPVALGELLPDAFDRSELGARREQSRSAEGDGPAGQDAAAQDAPGLAEGGR